MDGNAEMVERLREIARGRLLIRQSEAARALGISKPVLLREIENGRLRYVLVGKRRRFKPADLAAYIEKQESALCEDRSSSGRPGKTTGFTTSASTVIDFEAAVKLHPGRKQKA